MSTARLRVCESGGGRRATFRRADSRHHNGHIASPSRLPFPHRADAGHRLHRPRRRQLLRPACAGGGALPALHRPALHLCGARRRVLRSRVRRGARRRPAPDLHAGCADDPRRLRRRRIPDEAPALPAGNRRHLQRKPVLHAGHAVRDRRAGEAVPCKGRLLGHVVQGDGTHACAGVAADLHRLHAAPRRRAVPPARDCLTANAGVSARAR